MILSFCLLDIRPTKGEHMVALTVPQITSSIITIAENSRPKYHQHLQQRGCGETKIPWDLPALPLIKQSLPPPAPAGSCRHSWLHRNHYSWHHQQASNYHQPQISVSSNSKAVMWNDLIFQGPTTTRWAMMDIPKAVKRWELTSSDCSLYSALEVAPPSSSVVMEMSDR